MRICWVRRDARMHDNDALAEAAEKSGELDPLCVLYVYDSDELSSNTYHESHLTFINEGLHELDLKLRGIGGGVTFRVGKTLDVFRALNNAVGITAVHVHADVETKEVRATTETLRKWTAEDIGAAWCEVRQDGVVPTGRPTIGWADECSTYMRLPMRKAPEQATFVDEVIIPRGLLHSPSELTALKYRGTHSGAQSGGEEKAQAVLNDFITRRVQNYADGLSSPATAWEACSRLSAYLSWGHVSLRTVTQSLVARQCEGRAQKQRHCRRIKGTQAGSDSKESTAPLRSLAAFSARLRWRSHFSQKMHDEPRMETENLCRVYDGFRDELSDNSLYHAWETGRTGFPMIDACMRALDATGWINFRMRAMLVSFACHILRLDWRQLADPLARLFLDFAPGIHYPQLQMQAGTTGVNAVRIYNPTKQLRDHDPHGRFICEYVPELKRVPQLYLAEPWTMPNDVQSEAACRIGIDYPGPVVDFTEAYRRARSEFASIRSRRDAKEEAAAVYQKHGSRKRPRTRASATVDNISTETQQKRTGLCNACGAVDHAKGVDCPLSVTVGTLRSRLRPRRKTVDS